MAFPKHSGHNKKTRQKLISNEISKLIKEGYKKDQATAIAINKYEKKKTGDRQVRDFFTMPRGLVKNVKERGRHDPCKQNGRCPHNRIGPR